MSVSMYQGEPKSFVIVFDDDPLAQYGKSWADVTEGVFNLKKSLALDDDDKYLQKSSLDGSVFVDGANHQIAITFSQSDTKDLKADKYYGVVALQVAGFAEKIELDWERPYITIEPDKNRA